MGVNTIHTFSTLASILLNSKRNHLPNHHKADCPFHSHIILKTRVSHHSHSNGKSHSRILFLRSNNPSTIVSTETIELESAADVVRKFYGGINGRDLSTVEALIANNCIYEDLVFPRPFVGRKEIMEFFGNFVNTISSDLQFVIVDISEEDTCAVGVTWHLEWKGKPFPFSKGCSFYRLDVINGKRQIVYGRDVVEPSAKPGDAALVAIRGVTWLLERFPSLADRF